ncbi:MAG: nucleotidyl transferase AbiEii/AbiGii toxin family protein [Anaerolineaceae bacterium]|nr:nucleotidyl transferase AbiEii/AbiGii toxin family protein [Anaerolineaceae bacterium]
MPSVSQMIRSITQKKGVQQYIVEKDYALSYLVAAINATAELSENLVLKGGTALKKLYFGDYRFSEDLDYSTSIMGPIPKIDALIAMVVDHMREMLNERGPFQVAYESLILKQPHPGDQIAYLVRVQFPEQRQPLCRLKVEITIDEPICTSVDARPLLHGFPEDLPAQIPVYSLAEITVEKLRALLQSKERLHEKGWGASRVCRDYYDLWNLLRLPGLLSPDLIPLLEQKCAVRHVSFASPQDFISDDLLAVASSEWPQQLLPFVPEAPSAAEILPQVQSLILSVWE